METSTLFIGIAIVLVCAMVQGSLGFGFALIAVPLMAIMASPKLVVPTMMILGTASSLYLTYLNRHAVDLRRVWPLLLGAGLGVPVGIYLLLELDENILRLYVGVVVTIFAILLLIGVNYRVRAELRVSVLIGFASGVLGGSISIAGPPVVLFFSNQRISRDTYRATIVAYFSIVQAFALVLFSTTGLINLGTLKDVGFLAPGLAIGAVAGSLIAPRVPERLFRVITLIIVVAGGIIAVLSGSGFLII